jgi:hypothetical protein
MRNKIMLTKVIKKLSKKVAFILICFLFLIFGMVLATNYYKTYAAEDTSGAGPICLNAYQLWRDHFGAKTGEPNYDPRVEFTGDNFIDIRDYGIWRCNASLEYWCSAVIAGSLAGTVQTCPQTSVTPPPATLPPTAPPTEPPGPQVCEGFSRVCTTETGEAGTQWCTPGVTSGDACIISSATVCYKSKSDLTQGCKPNNTPAGCSSASPDGLQNSGQIMADGTPIFITADSTGGIKTVSLNKSSGSTLQTPYIATYIVTGTEYRQISPSESGLVIVASAVNPNQYVATIPGNNSQDTEIAYAITAKVRNPGSNVDVSCPAFAIKVPKSSAIGPCPTTITSSEVRMKAKPSDPWTTQINAVVGDSIQFAGYHNNKTDAVDPNMIIQITGPDGPTSQTYDVYSPSSNADPNALFFAPPLAGRYTVKGQVAYKTAGGACTASSSTITMAAKAVTTVSYKISDSPEGLATASAKPYNKEPLQVNVKELFAGAVQGDEKFVWVEFTDTNGKTATENVSITFVGGDPKLSSIDCSLDVNGKGMIVTVKGANFNSEQGQGKLTVNGGETDVTNWRDDIIVAHYVGDGFAAVKDKPFKIILTRNDGVLVSNQCRIGISQLSINTLAACRLPDNQTQANVKLSLIKIDTGERNDETVSINKEGVIQGMKANLQTDKDYFLILKSPKSLKKVMQFTAAKGTTVLSEFTLPMGDIFPLKKGDGVINSADKSELNREWLTIVANAKGGLRDGDFNQDTAVNSLDWACMRNSFGQTNDPDPTVEPSPSETPTPSPSPAAQNLDTSSFTPFTTPTPVPTPTALPTASD